MGQFNLLCEPFVPCLSFSGRVESYSLRDVIVNAPTLVSIASDSPLRTAAVYRLLLALLTSALPMRQPHDWADLRDRKMFPIDEIDAYLGRWTDRFDLFHPERPFYQTPGLDAYFGPIQKLFPERAAGNNDTLFDHTHEDSGMVVEAGAAALGLLTLQTFAVGGLVSFDAKEHRSAQGAPIAAGLMILVKGKTLFETLLLNLTQYDPKREIPFPVANGDRPAWEREEPVAPSDRMPEGLRDLMTFQARRVLLRSVEADDGGLRVDGVSILKGNQIDSAWPFRYREPYVAFRQMEDAKNIRDGWLPIRLSPERAIWRDSGALFSPQRQEENSKVVTRRPYHFEWLAALRRSGVLEQGWFDVMAFGQATDQANILLWREENLEFPAVFLASPEYTEQLKAALGAAESGAFWLRQAIRGTLERLGMNTTRNTPHLDAALRGYWSDLESQFGMLLRGLAQLTPIEGDEGELPLEGAHRMQAWFDAIRSSVRNQFQFFAGGLPGTARVLAAMAVSERGLETQIWRLLKNQAPQQEEVTAFE